MPAPRGERGCLFLPRWKTNIRGPPGCVVPHTVGATRSIHRLRGHHAALEGLDQPTPNPGASSEAVRDS